MKKLAYIILGLIIGSSALTVSAQLYTFTSSQVGTSPTSGYILKTDGSISSWVDPSSVFSSASSTLLSDTNTFSTTGTTTFNNGVSVGSLKIGNIPPSYLMIATTSNQITPYLPVNQADTPARDDVLKWNGSEAVWTTYSTTFAMTIASFDDGQSSPQLIGSGTWKATGALSFTASYNNPPPNSASINVSGTGVSWASPLTLTTPFTSGTSAENTTYPSSKDTTTTFTLTAYDGTTPRTSTASVLFNNYIYRGASATASGLTEANVEALTGTISSTYTGSNSFSSGVGTYMVLAFPASYTSVPASLDYETSGGTGFLFNSIAAAFTLDSSTLSITNSAGYVENYKVYVANTANLGSGTLSVSTTAQTIDKIYYGITTTASGYAESDVEGLANSSITNDSTQTWSSVTVGSGQYYLFAWPKRLGTVAFWVSGFEGGFEASETVSVTNANGFTEDYYVARSTNQNLGAVILETR